MYHCRKGITLLLPMSLNEGREKGERGKINIREMLV